jgi:hypothetical protein
MSKQTGSCHCGKVAYEFEGSPITEALECNCSMCGRKGSLLHFIPAEAFTLLTPRSEISTYHFNKGVIDHNFCRTCGVTSFSEGTSPKGDRMVAINARCVDGVDPRALKINFFNGRGAPLEQTGAQSAPGRDV